MPSAAVAAAAAACSVYPVHTTHLMAVSCTPVCPAALQGAAEARALLQHLKETLCGAALSKSFSKRCAPVRFKARASAGTKLLWLGMPCGRDRRLVALLFMLHGVVLLLASCPLTCPAAHSSAQVSGTLEAPWEIGRAQAAVMNLVYDGAFDGCR